MRCTSRSRWRATSWRRRRSSSPSRPPRRAVTPRRGCAAAGPVHLQGLQAAGRGLAGREGHPGLLRLRQGQPGAGVLVAGQGPGAGADLRPGRHRPGRRERRVPSSTTRTSRSRPSSSVCPAGNDARALSCVEQSLRIVLPPVSTGTGGRAARTHGKGSAMAGTLSTTDATRLAPPGAA